MKIKVETGFCILWSRKDQPPSGGEKTVHVLFPLEHQQVSLGVKTIFMAEKNSHITTLRSLFVEKSPERNLSQSHEAKLEAEGWKVGLFTQIHLQSSRNSTDSWHFQSYKKSETSYKLIKLSKKKGPIWLMLSPLKSHQQKSPPTDALHHRRMLWWLCGLVQPTAQSPATLLVYIYHISGNQVHLRQRPRCDTRSYSDCPVYSPAHLLRSNMERGRARGGKITRNSLF